MKKYLILGIAATAILSACSNDDVVDVKTGNAIGFSSFVGKQTRAEITKNNIGAFDVYGYTKGDSYSEIFKKEKVSRTQSNDVWGDWSYLNTQYWVSGNTYQFHAIAPEGIDAWAWTTTTEGDNAYTEGKIHFAINTGEDDLIYAYKGGTGVTTGQEVELTFNHLLSRVNFKFINGFTTGNVQFDVQYATIEDAYTSGDITVGAANVTALSSDNASRWDISNSGTGQIDFGAANNYKPIEYASDDSKSYGVTASRMLIPYGTDKEYKGKFWIRIYSYLAKENTSDKDVYAKYEFKDVEVTLPKVTMLPGYSYTYVVKLTGDSTIPGTSEFLKQIEFKVEGTDWPDDATSTLNTSTTTVKTDTETTNTNQGNSNTDTSNSGNTN
jgi:hypothetical protein